MEILFRRSLFYIGPLVWLMICALCLPACTSELSSRLGQVESDLGLIDDQGLIDTNATEDATIEPSMDDMAYDQARGDDLSQDEGFPQVVIPRLRRLGERAPPTASCDAADPSRCLLPWPSDTFTTLDATTETGLRLELERDALGAHDDLSAILQADGFSRVTPILTAIDGQIDPSGVGDGVDGVLQVIVCEPGDHFGERVPLRIHVVIDDTQSPIETALVAYPRRPLLPATEYVVVLTEGLRRPDGASIDPDRLASVAQGLEAPADQAEAAHYAYHNPSRLALDAAGLQGETALRLWTFSTRSLTQPIQDLLTIRDSMLDALSSDRVSVEIDEMNMSAHPSIALTVQGRLTGLPNHRDALGALSRNGEGHPEAVGVTEASFRVAVPIGEGDYRVIMYAHGMGGDVTDPSFDDLITGEGAGKVSLQFDDWTEAGLVPRFLGFSSAIQASDRVAAGFIVSIASGIAIQYALDGILGALLSAPVIEDEPNPAQGRRPNLDILVWAGGSLGGTAGAIYAGIEPTLQAAVINVPGAGMSHYLRFSMFYPVLEQVLRSNGGRLIDVELSLAMAQVALDPGDSVHWLDAATPAPVYLIQQSIGDPVLPNIGSDLAATTAKALHIGAVLHPVVDVEPADLAVGRSGFTQYKVASEDPYDIHGFGAGHSPAGLAAREQIRAFIHSVWAGDPQITLPQACIENFPAESCDFSGGP